jgi:hypothetical protein
MKLKNLLQQLSDSPRRFPVEAALGFVFFLIAFFSQESSLWRDLVGSGHKVNDDILVLFVPLLTLSFWLGRVNRWAYYASFFIFVPLLFADLSPFLKTFGCVFTYVLAFILLIVGNNRKDNRSFAAHALHVVGQGFFGLLISGLLTLAVVAICASFFYIFGIDEPGYFYGDVLSFIWFALAPQVCCTLIRQDEDEAGDPAKVLQLILNFILSPAVVIYTAILYVYFIKIAFAWDLPKGGVAWMVMGFISAALVGRLAQYILNRRYFDWYYRHLTWIALPPLVLYWIGSVYRIQLYSFTESRFYLMVAGVLMTLFVLMQLKDWKHLFQLMTLIVGFAIVLFTYIPGISARSIGLKCQKQRMEQMIADMNLLDAETGKLVAQLDVSRIKEDSLLCLQYREVCDIIQYVSEGMGNEDFSATYGEWEYRPYQFYYHVDSDNSYIRIEKTQPVDLGDYTLLLSSEDYSCRHEDGIVTVRRLKSDDVVLEYPIESLMQADSVLLSQPEQLLTYRNDSLMLVLSDVGYDSARKHVSVTTYDYLLFKKK